MGNLNQIADRRGRDRWKDLLFIGTAVLLTALSIGAVTSKAAGSASNEWSVQVIETNFHVADVP